MEKVTLWEAHFMSSYHDGDSMVPVSERFYVIADSYKEAEEKATPLLEKLQNNSTYKEKTVSLNVVTLENLIVARDSSNDGRMGWHSTTKLKPITLSLDNDKKQFRLAICLIPIEQSAKR
jgi:hypothetical protein